jgi:hypothetical protein
MDQIQRKERNLSENQRIPFVGYTYKTLAAATNLSVNFWRREVRLGRIPCVKFDNAVMILPADLDQYLASRRRIRNEESEPSTSNQ